MHRVRRGPGTRLALLIAAAVALCAPLARAEPAPPVAPVEPLLDRPSPRSPGPVALPRCPAALPEICALFSGVGAPVTLVAQPHPGVHRLGGPIGIQAAIGAGVTGFLTQRARAFANPGGAWEVRVTLGSRLPLAIEGAYIGSKQNLTMLGLERNGFILGNGGEGNLRFNVLPGRVQPYVFMGVGWTNYQLRDTQVRTADGRTSDDVFQVPFGGGLTVRGRHLFLDVRSTARLMFNDTLISEAWNAPPSMGPLASWTVTGRLGWQFR